MKSISISCRRGRDRRMTCCSILLDQRSPCCCLRGGSLRAWTKKQHERGHERQRGGEVEGRGRRELLPQPSGQQAGEERGDAGDEEEHPKGASTMFGRDRVRDQGLQHWLRQLVVESVESHRDPDREARRVEREDEIDDPKNYKSCCRERVLRHFVRE